MARLGRLLRRARRLEEGALVLYHALRDPRVPWYAKAVAALVVGYAFLPVDLIPDWIPFLGLLDDLVILPAGLALALRLIPGPVLGECRRRAGDSIGRLRPRIRAVILFVLGSWLLALAGAVWLFARLVR